MEPNKLLEIRNLVTEFRTEGKVLKAVNDISFTLNRGETIGIVGESGSGKSVLLKCLAANAWPCSVPIIKWFKKSTLEKFERLGYFFNK
jgi:ABC-type glutathione transport system ATPase component